jgi:hypothetical protein
MIENALSPTARDRIRGRLGNLIAVDFRKGPDPEPPKFPGGAALRALASDVQRPPRPQRAKQVAGGWGRALMPVDD